VSNNTTVMLSLSMDRVRSVPAGPSIEHPPAKPLRAAQNLEYPPVNNSPQPMRAGLLRFAAQHNGFLLDTIVWTHNSFNRKEWLAGCLRGLLQATVPHEACNNLTTNPVHQAWRRFG